jgi:hypothetical protein
MNSATRRGDEAIEPFNLFVKNARREIKSGKLILRGFNIEYPVRESQPWEGGPGYTQYVPSGDMYVTIHFLQKK